MSRLLPRIALWVCLNGAAVWFAGSVICRQSPESAALTFGLVLGFMQSIAISRSLREALSWTLLTAITLPLAGLLVVVLLFLTLYGSALFHQLWIPGAIIGLLVGGAVSIAQAAIFAMRDQQPRVIRIWTVGNSLAAGVVGAALLGNATNQCGPQDLAGAAVGVVFGLLTAVPLALAST